MSTVENCNDNLKISEEIQIPTRPVAPKVNFDAIPENIRDLRIFGTWDFEFQPDRGKKWTKVPKRANCGFYAKSNDPDHWITYEELLTSWESNVLKGRDGVAVRLSHGILGVDIDHCRNPETGEIHSMVKPIIDGLATYWEVSPSGTGVHALMFASMGDLADKLNLLPDHLPKKYPIPAVAKDCQIEIYDCSSARFFTLTGNALAEGVQVEECQRDFENTYRDLLSSKIAELQESKKKRESQVGSTGSIVPESIDDQQLLDKARNASNGEKFRALYDEGSLGLHDNDHSRADQSLCCLLAFWCGDDPERIDRLFRASALNDRDKWDKHKTYARETIRNAIDGTTAPYDWSTSLEKLPSDAEIAEIVMGSKSEPAPIPVPTAKELEDIGQFRDHPLFGYLWKGTHRRITDADRMKRMKSVLDIWDLIPKTGFFPDYIRSQLPTSDCSVLYHLAGALAVAGHAVGRQAHVRFGNQKIYPNFWACVLGPSSIAHKSSAISSARELLGKTEIKGSIMPDGWSFEGMLEEIGVVVPRDDDPTIPLRAKALEILQNKRQGMELNGLAFTKGRAFFYASELGAFLNTLDKSQGAKEHFTEIYDCPPEFEKKTRGSGLYYVPEPTFTCLVASTKSWLVNNSSETDIQGGFLPRWVFFNADDKDYCLPVPDQEDEDAADAALEGLHRLMDANGVYKATESDFYCDWRVEIEKRYMNNPSILAWAIRLSVVALKIALLYDASQGHTGDLTLDSIQRAIRLVELLLGQMGTILQSLAFDEDGKNLTRLRDAFRQIKRDEWISRRDLLRSTRLRSQQLDYLIRTLLDEDAIEEREGEKSPNGKIPIYYRMVR